MTSKRQELFVVKRSEKCVYLVLASLLVLLVLVIVYFDYCTKLRFSVLPGFYANSVSLEIKGLQKYRIFYTLDGSDPTEQSTPYDGGVILLEDATENANVYSARTDTSTGFEKELIKQYSRNDPAYVVPSFNVKKCNIVRARAFDENGKCIDEICGSYFVGSTAERYGSEVLIISLTTDPSNLFDAETGIYTTGNIWKATEKILPEGSYRLTPFWWWWDSNYSVSGYESERRAYIEIYSGNGEPILSEECGIRIKGGGSRGLLPKSLSLYARNEYAGSEKFSVDVLETGSRAHKYSLFSGGDDCIFKIKDFIVHSIEKNLHFSTITFKPAVLYLDGEFWGAYYLTEDYNSDYVSDHYGVSKDDIILVKENKIDEGDASDIDFYNTMWSYIAEQDMTVDENYREAQNLIDMDSFTDYYAAQIFIGRYNDWPAGGGNCALWRSGKRITGKDYADAKWRWMLFDVNSGSLDSLEHDSLAAAIDYCPMFASLLRNDDFRQKFKDRLYYIANEIYSDEKIDAYVDYYLDVMIDPISDSNMRFYGNARRAETMRYAEGIRTILKGRSDVVRILVKNNLESEYMQ